MPRTLAIGCGVICAVVLAGCGGSRHVQVAGLRGLQPVTEVPTVLPPVGVNVNDQAVFRPLPASPAAGLSAAEAIRAARHLDDAHPVSARALEASATAIGSSKIIDVPAWVVTFTSPKPVNVEQGETILVSATHDSIVLDAVTGKMLFGIFTK